MAYSNRGTALGSFDSTLLQGTIYSGFDDSPIGEATDSVSSTMAGFLGSDSPSFQPENSGSSTTQLGTGLLDITGSINVTSGISAR